MAAVLAPVWPCLGYGLDGFAGFEAGGAVFTAAGGVVTGTVVPGTGAVAAGAVSGDAGAAPVGAGAVETGTANLSSTDFGTELRPPMTCRMSERPRKMPPHHHVIDVSRFPACRVPINASDDELAPPKFAAKPPPFPDCKRTTTISNRASRTRIVSRKVYMAKTG